MQMLGRNVGSDYKFGMNGQIIDSEIKGDGNSLDFMYRGYDPRLGRFTSKDPMANFLPWVTPYAYAENRPIDGIDYEGKEHMQFNYHLNREGKITSIDDLSEHIKQLGKKGWGILLNFYMFDGNDEKLIKTSFIPTKAPFIWTGSNRPFYVCGKKLLDETTAVNAPDGPFVSAEIGVSQTINSPLTKSTIKASIYEGSSEYSKDYKASYDISMNSRIDNWGDKVSVGTNVKLFMKFNRVNDNDYDPTIGFQIPIVGFFYGKITYGFRINENKQLESYWSNIEFGLQANTNGNKPSLDVDMKMFKADLRRKTFGVNPAVNQFKTNGGAKNSSKDSKEGSYQNARFLD